jgi:phenylpropionate dioxygenase-like ring-hydroxylating dioxygenase large terminal subunit
MTYTTDQIAQLIEPARVHRNVYLDEALFELEMERIWGRAWIFIGHESQVKNPGDFITARINHRIPVIMTRDRSGQVHVLHNRCAHKGAKLVDTACGNARAFRCCYHGWTFNVDGSLLKIPNEKGYEGTGFAIGDPCNNIQKAARCASYRGFVFATLDANAPDLKVWLGGAAACFDNLCDRAPDGEVEAAGGVLRFEHDCNWKLFIENLNDTMHPMVTHQSVVNAAQDYIATLPEGATQRAEAEIIPPFGASYEVFENSGITGFRYGHHYDGGKTSIHAGYSVPPAYEQAMLRAYGAERTREILSFNTHNTLYYPSLTIKTAVQNIRVVRPIAVNKTIIETWSFRLKGAPDEMLQRTLLYSRLVNSSGSMVGSDDLEAYMRIQDGLNAPGSDWIEMYRQFGRDRPLPDRTVGGGTSDLDVRTQYAAWKAYMTEAMQ